MEKNKRYVTTISFYTYAKTDQDALDESNEICDKLKSKYDNHASVDSLHSQPFGLIGSTKINIKKLK